MTTLANAHPGPWSQRYHSQIHGCDEVHIRNIFSKFPTNHLLGNLDLLVCLAVVDSEAQTDKVGQNGCGALLRPDWRRVGGRGECPREGETVYPVLSVSCCNSFFRERLVVVMERGSCAWVRGGFHIRDDIRACESVLAGGLFQLKAL